MWHLEQKIRSSQDLQMKAFRARCRQSNNVRVPHTRVCNSIPSVDVQRTVVVARLSTDNRPPTALRRQSPSTCVCVEARLPMKEEKPISSQIALLERIPVECFNRLTVMDYQMCTIQTLQAVTDKRP